MGISNDSNGDSHSHAAAANNHDATASSPESQVVPEVSAEGIDGKPTAGIMSRIWYIVTWVPPACRYDPKNPPKLTLALNILFGIACTFTVCGFFS
jgi:hypothetical protein